jgi:hypothetical protein
VASDFVNQPHNIVLGAPSRIENVKMTESWRIDVDDKRILLGMVTDAFLGIDGSVYLLDSQLQQVVRVSADGKIIDVVCRSGEGPGELSNVFDIERLSADTLGLLSVVPPAMTVVDVGGIYRRTIKFSLLQQQMEGSQYFTLLKCRVAGDGFVGVGEQTLMSGGALQKRRFLAYFDSNGHERTVFDQHDRVSNFSEDIRISERGASFPVGDAWAVDTRGRTYTSTNRDRYAIQVLNSNGDILSVIERNFPPHHRSAKEKEEAKQNFAVASTGNRPNVSIEVDAYDPVILDMLWLDNCLWVMNCDWKRHLTDSATARFDVIDPDTGVWIERLLQIPLNTKVDMLIPLNGQRMLRVVNLMGAFDSVATSTGSVVGEDIVDLHDKGGEEDLAIIMYEAVD